MISPARFEERYRRVEHDIASFLSRKGFWAAVAGCALIAGAAFGLESSLFQESRTFSADYYSAWRLFAFLCISIPLSLLGLLTRDSGRRVFLVSVTILLWTLNSKLLPVPKTSNLLFFSQLQSSF